MPDTHQVEWSDWADEAFGRAAAADRPVLLSLVVSWSHACREMDRTSYLDPAVVQLAAARFVPIRVDAERRPDIAERYGLGGWPTTVLLTPRGDPLAGGTFLTPGEFAAMLARVAEAYATRRDELEARAAEIGRMDQASRAAAACVDTGAVDWMIGRIAEAVDATYGGLGTAPKEPHAAAALLAIERAGATGDGRLQQLATASLEALDHLLDPIDEGFFRCCAHRDWTGCQTEKLLDTQAALLTLDVAAWRRWSEPRYRERALGTIRYAETTLAGPDGFLASQAADETYYARDAAGRRQAPPPPIDGTLYTDANARMSAALLAAAEAFDLPGPGERAIGSLESVLLVTYERGAGVAHWPGGVRGLLGDQVAMSAALLDAYGYCERDAYADLARELMYTAVRTMWDPEAGGFLDRVPGGAGRLAEPVKPFAINCEAAIVLGRLAALTGEADLGHRAEQTLAAIGGEARAHGLAGAPYARALVTLAGPAGFDPRSPTPNPQSRI